MLLFAACWVYLLAPMRHNTGCSKLPTLFTNLQINVCGRAACYSLRKTHIQLAEGEPTHGPRLGARNVNGAHIYPCLLMHFSSASFFYCLYLLHKPAEAGQHAGVPNGLGPTKQHFRPVHGLHKHDGLQHSSRASVSSWVMHFSEAHTSLYMLLLAAPVTRDLCGLHIA